MSIIIQLLYFVFILAAVVLIVVILLQEGKGGGFGQALGTSGQETFGAGARGINTFTAVVVGVFLGSAMLITVLNRLHGQTSAIPGGTSEIPATSEPAGAPPPAGPPSDPGK
jgi:preprotein translocase subunit SecG